MNTYVSSESSTPNTSSDPFATAQSSHNCENAPVRHSHRFAKNQRLLTKPAYTQVFNDAPIRASHPCFLLLCRSNDNQTRLGLVIAKKHVKRANQRNRIKRLVRESFRLQQHKLPAIDVIVLARKGADTLTNSEILVIINGLWKRISKRARPQSPDSPN